MATTLAKFVWEPSWLSNVSMQYGFLTVIEKSKTFKEQRRPLLSTPIREIKADFLLQKTEVRNFVNTLRILALNFIAVPVFIEVIRPNIDLQGKTVLTTSQTLVNYWNTQNASIILLLSPILSELKQVQSIGENSITVTNFVVGDFQKKNTIIYPCFPGIIQSKRLKAETDALVSCEVEFKETFLEWTL